MIVFSKYVVVDNNGDSLGAQDKFGVFENATLYATAEEAEAKCDPAGMYRRVFRVMFKATEVELYAASGGDDA